MISKEVLQNGSSATLKLSIVQESLVQCTKHSQIATEFETILALFPAGATLVPILGDQHLNKELENLGQSLVELHRHGQQIGRHFYPANVFLQSNA
jgi:hypothetical protein